MRLASIFLLFAVPLVYAQQPSPTASSELLLDNDYVRIARLEVSPGAFYLLPREHDSVVINLPDGHSGGSVSQQTEEVNFIPKGASLRRLEGPARAVVVELKHHWDAEVRLCQEPRTCSHSILAGGLEIGQTTSLFSNGFLTAYRHRLVKGGTLDSSYYSAHGVDHIVVVPLTAAHANFDGIEQDLEPGQPFFSAATQVEVTAKDHEVRWVVLRIATPKK